MAKRPRYSRWRRLPPVFRTGEHRPIGSGNELDRIILYLPSPYLDLAERLAEKAGVPVIQDYCELLLIQAIDAEQVRQKVSGFEARRGPLEGLNQIAHDPEYLSEWQARKPSRPAGAGGGTPPSPGDAITVDMALADGDDIDMLPGPDEFDGEGQGQGQGEGQGGMWFVDDGSTSSNNEDRGEGGGFVEPARPESPPPYSVRLDPDRSAMAVLRRHVAAGEDDQGFLPCLRRGRPVPGPKSAELLHALAQLEREHRGAEVLDRRMAHALHRLALEAQVLLTDAWPGVFDDNMIATIRAVQEGVERVLSGEDIRYS